MSDYDRIAKAIAFITSQVNNQPGLAEAASHLNMSQYHFQRLFCRWAGVTPKRYLQILTLERAKQLLGEAKPLLEVTHSLGLSSTSRLYDHFVQLEAVTPGEFKKGGKGLSIEYAVHETPFGKAFIAVTARGICQFAFLDYENIHSLLLNLTVKWPHARIRENYQGTRATVESMFAKQNKPDRPLSLYVAGTNFQVSVWRALLQIPPGSVVSYSQVATEVGQPRAARAVGTAIGANPVAFLIPCHRVIRQSGHLGGYHWGENRMHAIHAWESARYD